MLFIKKTLHWKLLFEALMTSLGENKPEFTVEEDGDLIRIVTKNPNDAAIIKNHLETILNSRPEFMKNLPYQFTLSTSSSQTNLNVTTPTDVLPPGATVEELKTILQNLLGPRFEELALDIDVLFGKKAKVKDGVLFSKPALTKGIAKAWHEALNVLIRCFAGVDIETIRRSYSGGGALSLPKDSLADDDSAIAQGLVQQCFGIQTRKDDAHTVMYFDAECLYQLIAKPLLRIQTTETISIEIVASHLLMYLKQMVGDEHGTILRIYKDKDDLTVARPIFLGRKSPLAIANPRIYTFIIDRSSSLGDYFDDIKKYLASSIATLAARDPDAKLRLIFFGDNADINEFSLSEIEKIKRFIASTFLGGMTRLFDTISDEIDVIIREKLTQNNNVAVLLFTDGSDNLSAQRTINQAIKKLTEARLPYPKFFTLGVGDCDTNTLTKLATTMGNSYIHLPRISEMSNVLEGLALTSSFTAERTLHDLMVELSDQKASYTVPVYEDNSPTAPDVKIYIPMANKDATIISVDGKKYQVVIPDHQALPGATATDNLVSTLSAVRQALLSQDPIGKKRQALENYLVQIDHESGKSTLDSKLYSDAKTEINYYLQELIAAENDPHRYSALMSQVASSRQVMTAHAHCSADGTCQPAHTNGPELPLINRGSTERIIYHHFRRGRGSYEQTLGYQLLSLPSSVIQAFHEWISPSSSQQLVTLDGFCHPNAEPVPYPYSDQFVFKFLCTVNGRIVGRVSLYGDITPCSLDGRNNIIAISGEKSFQQAIEQQTQKNVCSSLPPTTLKIHGYRIAEGAKSGAILGALRGAENITYKALLKSRCQENAAWAIAKGSFYSNYFLTQFTINFNAEDVPTSCVTAGTQTAWLAATEFGLWATQKACHWFGQKASDNGLPKTAAALHKMGQFAPKLLLAKDAITPAVIEIYSSGTVSADSIIHGIESTAAAVGTGMVCEEIVKTAGNRVMR